MFDTPINDYGKQQEQQQRVPSHHKQQRHSPAVVVAAGQVAVGDGEVGSELDGRLVALHRVVNKSPLLQEKTKQKQKGPKNRCVQSKSMVEKLRLLQQ